MLDFFNQCSTRPFLFSIRLFSTKIKDFVHCIRILKDRKSQQKPKKSSRRSKSLLPISVGLIPSISISNNSFQLVEERSKLSSCIVFIATDFSETKNANIFDYFSQIAIFKLALDQFHWHDFLDHTLNRPLWKCKIQVKEKFLVYIFESFFL